ncbi:acyl-CoA dehydrogenase family protein [Acerihabitans arboris]|uniref:acyl-CoA dehydrogenase family protein n=1 Tax=Acerihabitans arboris TaxID=2691583 RepID=UPI0028A5A761|nr:acyl-CoA dehydrogenase family protein [Acerihabitans arboris]
MSPIIVIDLTRTDKNPMTFSRLLAAAGQFGALFGAGAARRDQERQLPREEIASLAGAGLLAARVPREYGGSGVSLSEWVRLMLPLAQGDPNIAQAIQPHACGIEKLRIYGTPAQRRRYLGVIGDGALITNASAERDTGVVGQIATRLAREGAGWRLDGTKHYATGSLFAQYFYVLANDDNGGRALALLPVDRRGVHIKDDWNGMGQRTTASGSVTFDHVLLADDEILPLPEWKTRRTYEGAFAQLLHAVIDTGIALGALEDAAEYGRSRARPVSDARVDRAGDDPYVQQAVGEMSVLAHGAEALVGRAAGRLEQAMALFWRGADAERALGEASVAVAEAKVAAEQAALRVSEMLYRVGGAGATVQTLNLDRHWRNARTHTTHDPIAYKTKTIGDFVLNDRLPPIGTKI